MSFIGWKYLKLSECADCHEAGTLVYVPVTEGKIVDEARSLYTGTHVPHFLPVCKKCRSNYSEGEMCSKHNLPLLRNSTDCRMCFNPPKSLRDRGVYP